MLSGMRAPQLANVDLNLLPALAALLSERSVSRAAVTVGLSQSAMSRSLARLRRVLDDQLLVRGADGYQLTPAAEQLRTQVDEVLPRLHEMFLNREYQPSTATREFRMAGSDYALATFGPTVFAAVLAAAPLASVRFLPWHTTIVRDLTDGGVDLLFHGMHLADPIRSRLLFTDQMVCVVHRDHPLSKRKSLTIDQYLGCNHLVIDIVDGTQPSIDTVLLAHGRSRRAGLTVPYHATAPAALFGTDLVLSIPTRVITNFVDGHSPELVVLRAPVEIRALPYFMSWHSRQEYNKGHEWLRGLTLNAISDQ